MASMGYTPCSGLVVLCQPCDLVAGSLTLRCMSCLFLKCQDNSGNNGAHGIYLLTSGWDTGAVCSLLRPPKTVNIWGYKKCQSPDSPTMSLRIEGRSITGPSSSDLVEYVLSHFYSRVGDLVTRRAPEDAVVEGEV